MPIKPILSLLSIALLASACYLPPPVYYVQERPGMSRVPGPPPGPRLEVPPLQPDESYLWREGYWAWDGNEYQWVAGEWIPPQAGYLFIASSVVFADGCWQYRPPYWCPESLCGGSHRGGHQGGGGKGGKGVIAHGPAVPVDNPERSARVRAPEAPDAVRVRAPEAQASAEPVRVRAPEAPDLKDPDADAPTAGKRLPAWQDDRYLTGRRPSITLDDGQESLAGGEPDEPSPALRRRPEYLGTRAGRPVFGDDPTSERPRAILPEHRTDATGAIVLAEPREPRPARWGRVIVVRRDGPRFADPGAGVPSAAVGRIHGPDTTVAPPTLHRVPPPVAERPSFSYRAPSPAPVYRPIAPAPVYRPSAPAPVYRPSAPAPVYRPSAPSHLSAPQAPARVSAPAMVAATPGRRHR